MELKAVTMTSYETSAAEFAADFLTNPDNALAIVREAMATSQGPDPDGSWLIEISSRYTRDGRTLPFTMMAKVMINGRSVYWDAAGLLMDHDLREELHAQLAPCDPQEFADAYCTAHLDKFGEEFIVN